MPKKKETSVIFCAHPDDEILGVGGTIAQYAKEGKRTIAVIFSKGEKSHPWMQEKHMHEMRIKESLDAGAIVGTHDTIFLGLRDSKLSEDLENPEVLARIRAIIEKYKPEKVFTHDQDDIIYPDHRAVHKAVMWVVDAMIQEKAFDGAVYTFNIWFLSFRKRKTPKLVVDISDTFKKKREALKVFKSQKVALLQLVPFVYAKAFFDGIDADTKYAEMFHKIR
jgi:LmbE family N-acetylglucosaminyl deacetylase